MAREHQHTRPATSVCVRRQFNTSRYSQALVFGCDLPSRPHTFFWPGGPDCRGQRHVACPSSVLFRNLLVYVPPPPLTPYSTQPRPHHNASTALAATSLSLRQLVPRKACPGQVTPSQPASATSSPPKLPLRLSRRKSHQLSPLLPLPQHTGTFLLSSSFSHANDGHGQGH